MIEINILIEKQSSRLDFVINFLEERLRISMPCILDRETIDSNLLIIDFGGSRQTDDVLTMYNSGLLDQRNELTQSKPSIRKCDHHIELFPSYDTAHDIRFDLFASIFFCLSRYEEYQSFTADRHGRFPAAESHAHANAYLQRPVVDEWIVLLHDMLERKWNIKLPPPMPFDIAPTIDVDVAWAYLYRERIHPLGSQLKKLVKGQDALLQEQREAYKTGHDPFDTFTMLKEKLQAFNCHYFFLCHHAPPIDTAYFLDKIKFKNLIREQDSFATVGIHPSYASAGDQAQILQEKEWLEQTIGRSINSSRQHYLKMSLPQTYRDLIASGIQHDFSMGYADQCGFRAGTSMPFYFYDLIREEQTNLLIHPFSVMDVTLKDYQSYSIDQAIQVITDMKQRLRGVNGRFSFIWHNSSFAQLGGWDGWDRVFDVLIER